MAASNPSPSPQLTTQKRRRLLWIVIAIALIVLIAAVGFLISTGALFGKTYFDFTSVNETLVYADSNQTNVISLPNLVGRWGPIGDSFIIDPYFSNNGTANYSITNIISNTTGFTVTNIFPPLPVQIPTSSASNVTIQVTFSIPKTSYTGSFNFTVYLTPY
jgi:hypothetical protein